MKHERYRVTKIHWAFTWQQDEYTENCDFVKKKNYFL